MARVNLDLTIDRDYRVSPSETDHTSGSGQIYATATQLATVFGKPYYADPTLKLGGGKTSIEWHVATPRGPFAIYDWKQYDRPAASHMDEVYLFHLGDNPIELPDCGVVNVLAIHTFRILGECALDGETGDRYEPAVREALASIYAANFAGNAHHCPSC